MTHEILTHTLETMGDVAERKRTLPPTTQQARVLDAIRRLTVGETPPSYSELCDEVGVSISGIHRLLSAMKDRGLVEFEYGRARSLRIADELAGLMGKPTAELLKIRENIDRILISRPPA